MGDVRVFHVTSGHRASDARIFHKEARSLANAGYDVTLIAQHDRDETLDGIKIMALPRPRGRFHRMFVSPWQIFFIARRQHADVYHFHDPDLMLVGMLLKLSTRAKVIYDIHEDVPKMVYNRDWIPGSCRRVVAWLVKHLERFFIKRFSATVSADPEIGERVRMVNRRGAVVQNFPLLEEFPVGIPHQPSEATGKIVLSLGGLSPLRSIFEIVRAMSLLPAESDTRLILGGDADSQAVWEEVSEKPGWERVDYRGRIPRQEAMNILRSADVSLVLFSPAPNHFVVRSNRLFETLAAGVPVITSNFQMWREIVEGIGCGLTVDPLDPEASAEAIEYLLTHPEEASQMGQRGRKAALERYNWETEQGTLLQLYQELLYAA